jgi:F-type H+-transporting ATPase subunit delta
MNVSPVAYRYARSLMDLALEKGQLQGVHEDMRLVADACADSADLRMLLKSPVIKADTKDRVLDQVFAGKIGEISNRFMGILVRKGREGMLAEIARGFSELYKQNQGILTAEVTSAVPLDEAARQQVRDMAVKKHPGKSIQLSEKVDPSLIGGLIIRIGDEQIDGSVSRRLHELRRKFSENPYIPEI